MPPTRRRGHGSGLEPAYASAALEQALQARGCTPTEVERAKALWHEFLGKAGVTSLTGSAESWCAALHYLVAPLSGHPLTQKAVGTLYRISAATLSGRVKLITADTDQAALQAGFPSTSAMRRRRADGQARPRDGRGSLTAMLAVARKLTVAPARTALDEGNWIAIFRRTHRLLAHLYGDKTHVDILHYLAHVELNLRLAGYALGRQIIADEFGKLFPRIGLQAAKGRDARKFVYLHDVFGRQEPFTLLSLEYDDG
jgi:hypothetical protein